MQGNWDYLTKLPHELLHNILRGVDPPDLEALSETCQKLRTFTKDNHQLFKDIYATYLDEPPDDCVPPWYDYHQALVNFVKSKRILEGNGTIDEKAAKLHTVASCIETLLRTARPDLGPGESKNISLLSTWFGFITHNTPDGEIRISKDNNESFLCHSTTFNRARISTEDEIIPTISFQDRQISAKLHVLFGVPIHSPNESRYKNCYGYAASMCYDLRNYTEPSFWGPYLPNGQATVDWEKIEAVMINLGQNINSFSRQTRGMFIPPWEKTWSGATPNSYKSRHLRKGGAAPIEVHPEDPYNITGTWLRVVCFLDFHDLFDFNFRRDDPPPGAPRPYLDDTQAIRLIVMEIRVTHTEEPGPDDGQDLPVVHFVGTSRSMHTHWDPNADSNLRGNVRLTKEGEVRWQTISVYNGYEMTFFSHAWLAVRRVLLTLRSEDRWKSEGIQIGGLRSQRGVLGHWFDVNHDIHGPAGPSAYWKMSDEIDDRDSTESDADAGADVDDEDDEDFEGEDILIEIIEETEEVEQE